MRGEEKFSGKATHYDSARPSYAESLLDVLYADFGFSAQSVIADIGSGTGIFTEQLLKRGSTVYGVEPNADMRETGEKRLKGYSNFISVSGDAVNTGLADNSIDIVTAAQALHWFPLEEFRKECKRILKRNGKVVIVYNERSGGAVNEKINAAIARRCDLGGASTGPAFIEANQKKIDELYHGEFDEIRKSNSLLMDREKFISYWLSRSYAPREGDKAYEPFIDDLNAIFDEYAKDDIITVEQQSVAYIGSLR
ncbi:MAG: class I SAM-dependent methyltransferase [Clostridiales bacterium]|nr:class I SAM-dependent methyltransferase [Clostridiales bacterium]